MPSTSTDFTTGYSPVDSLTITLIGNATANINFNFDAELVTITEFKNVMNANKESWWDYFSKIIELFAGFILGYLTGNPVAEVGYTQTLPIPESMLSAIFQLHTTKVHIDGQISMANHSNVPITAKVFVETLTVSNNGKKQQVINPKNMFLGYINQNLKGRQSTTKITPIQGATITASTS